jgi:uncharacterized protein
LKYGFDQKKPLSSKLSSDDWITTQSAAVLAGLPVDAIDQMRPWFAAVSLALAGLMKEGYDPLEGVDRQLEVSARASQKVAKTFETPEQQMLLYASLPEQFEIAFLVQTLDELRGGSKYVEYVDGMASAWLAGDTGELKAMVLDKLKEASPELYDALFVKRNLNWCDQIATIMQGTGTSFVAVGAGHLVGDESVPAILAKRGFTVTPY